MSFKASQVVCKAVLNWAPATETIEQVVLGMGREAVPFMKQLQAPAGDGEVLVIEADGKCPPIATEAELAKRCGKRQAKHEKDCPCGCQRHRGKAKRKARGKQKTPEKGGQKQERQGSGGDRDVHSATWRGRQAARTDQQEIVRDVRRSQGGGAVGAGAEATKRGFGPDTTKTVRIVLDGVESLKSDLEELFPKAIFTLDICHVVERLWSLGRHYHKEGTEALKEWVDDLKALLYAGEVKKLLVNLHKLLRDEPLHGPGTKGRRDALQEQIGFLEKRVEMMRYGEWIEKDMVIASGQAEGAVRHLVGERFDCAGMRWTQTKAEALLHLRCVELNGDWSKYVAWFQSKTLRRLKQRKGFKVLTNQPLTLQKAA